MSEFGDFNEAKAKAAAVINGMQLPYSPPPATPTPQPPAYPTMPNDGGLGQFNGLMQAMMGIEVWKGQMMANERARESQIEARIRSQLESQYAMMGEAGDPIMQEAAHELIQAFKEGRSQHRNRGNSSPPAAKTTPNTATAAIAPPAPSNEVDNVKMYSQEEIDKIADKVEDYFPKECRECRSGALTKEQACALIIEKDPWKKTDQALAERIYEAIMAVVPEQINVEPKDPAGAA